LAKNRSKNVKRIERARSTGDRSEESGSSTMSKSAMEQNPWESTGQVKAKRSSPSFQDSKKELVMGSGEQHLASVVPGSEEENMVSRLRVHGPNKEGQKVTADKGASHDGIKPSTRSKEP
jgi:hypothetical protein